MEGHGKSMSLGQLAVHVADMPAWIRFTFDRDVLDAANAPRPHQEIATHDALMERFDQNVRAMRTAVANFDISRINDPWTMRNGAQVIVTRPRLLVYRIYTINHLIHHRGQLCVYLRLLNVPVPTVYFNTADDPNFIFE